MLLQRFGLAFVILVLGSILAAAEAPAKAPPKEENDFVRARYPVTRHYTKPTKPAMSAIHLPESVLRDLVAKLDAKQRGAGQNGAAPGPTVLPSIPHGATVFAGLAISLAMISLVVMRQRRPAWRWVAGSAGAIFVGVVLANYLHANAPAPIRDPRQELQPQEECLVVVTNPGEEIRIFVTKETE